MFDMLYEVNCHTQYFIEEKYLYFCDILIKLYAQTVQQKFQLDVVIREGANVEFNLNFMNFGSSWYLQDTYVIYPLFFMQIQNLVTIFVVLCKSRL